MLTEIPKKWDPAVCTFEIWASYWLGRNYYVCAADPLDPDYTMFIATTRRGDSLEDPYGDTWPVERPEEFDLSGPDYTRLPAWVARDPGEFLPYNRHGIRRERRENVET